MVLSQSGTQFYSTCADGLVVTLQSSGASPVSGSVTARVFVQPTAPVYSGDAYIRRYYDITPASSPNTATATVTLYYTQADFNDYNANNGSDPDVPANPSDAAGIANLKFTQQHGSSPSGLPGTYTGWAGAGPASVVIDPVDANIIWNTTAERWEVTFDVTGFFGFGNINGLPLEAELINLSAAAK